MSSVSFWDGYIHKITHFRQKPRQDSESVTVKGGYPPAPVGDPPVVGRADEGPVRAAFVEHDPEETVDFGALESRLLQQYVMLERFVGRGDIGHGAVESDNRAQGVVIFHGLGDGEDPFDFRDIHFSKAPIFYKYIIPQKIRFAK